MGTVYIVTSGCYSDYKIDGVFSTRELAELAIRRGWGENIEEFDIDPNEDLLRTGWGVYEVYMNREGSSAIHESSFSYPQPLEVAERSKLRAWPNLPDPYSRTLLHGYVRARDESHAAKIANKRRTALIAGGEWKEPTQENPNG